MRQCYQIYGYGFGRQTTNDSKSDRAKQYHEKQRDRKMNPRENLSLCFRQHDVSIISGLGRVANKVYVRMMEKPPPDYKDKILDGT